VLKNQIEQALIFESAVRSKIKCRRIVRRVCLHFAA
jgi:hypothetical protein